MKTYILDLIPKIRKYSQQLDDTAILTGKHWVLLGEDGNKTVYIFRKINNQLLISKNGLIEKANWEHIGNGSIVVDVEGKSYLFKHGFIDDTVLALKLDGTKEYVLFIDEKVYEKFLNSLETVLTFLENNYLNKFEDESLKIRISNKEKKYPSITTNSKITNTEKKIKPGCSNDNDLKFTFKSSYPESEFKIYKQKGKWGYIDKEKNVVIDFIFEDAFPFSEGLAVVVMNQKKGFIDRNGNVIIDYQFDSATYFKNGIADVVVNKDKFQIDKLGNKTKVTNK
ncbi:WG containing repeat-containing protein [Pustulibacterium marinum]|uniref:WG containing repeat-containing protein n=1 Tax=Pustulibacterium marinum TaxID=1224947 RepID=A0A1I7IB26_9FLAO|nr:WG repeat-containing protein [Pustulibacterium marinum]SFU70173.1 WG containing repeat-containing protein [Pustulibacterium marinum]